MSNDLLGQHKKGKIFILSGPAGSGKTTLVSLLVKEFREIVLNISFTTRAPRGSEVNGVDYFFVSKEEFASKIAKNDFLEHVDLFGAFYGSSRSWVESKLNEGKHVFLVINTDGALTLKEELKAPLIFVKPPSIEVLAERLKVRNSEKECDFKNRLLVAKKELELSKFYTYQFVNNNLETAYTILRSIVIAELHKN